MSKGPEYTNKNQLNISYIGEPWTQSIEAIKEPYKDLPYGLAGGLQATQGKGLVVDRRIAACYQLYDFFRPHAVQTLPGLAREIESVFLGRKWTHVVPEAVLIETAKQSRCWNRLRLSGHEHPLVLCDILQVIQDKGQGNSVGENIEHLDLREILGLDYSISFAEYHLLVQNKLGTIPNPNELASSLKESIETILHENDPVEKKKQIEAQPILSDWFGTWGTVFSLLPNLKSLQFSHKTLWFLAGYAEYFSGIESLELENFEYKVEQSDLWGFQQIFLAPKNLKSLSILENLMHLKDLDALISSLSQRYGQSLETLCLKGSKFENFSEKIFELFSQFRNIKHLIIEPDVGIHLELLTQLINKNSLESLAIECDILGYCVIKNLWACPHLKVLSLRNNYHDMLHEGVKIDIFCQSFPNLEKVYLEEGHLSTFAFWALLAQKQSPFKTLHLKEFSFSDSGDDSKNSDSELRKLLDLFHNDTHLETLIFEKSLKEEDIRELEAWRCKGNRRPNFSVLVL